MPKLTIKFIISFVLVVSSNLYAGSLTTVKVAALQFGTANWELDVIRHHKLDEKYGFELDVLPVAGKNAASVALNANAVDVIYGDWVWVNRQRHNGHDYRFSPVSTATGGIYVQSESDVHKLTDFNGERFGIAGGSVDKSWLILQAYFKHKYGENIASKIEPVYAAPPLINRLMDDNRLPAALNFWHYSARLEAKGFRPIISVAGMLSELGIKTPPPFVGWIFNNNIPKNKHQAVTNFLKASEEARAILKMSDPEWERIKPLVKADNERIFNQLKTHYRNGTADTETNKYIDSIVKIYSILATEGGKELTGGVKNLDLSLFWNSSPSSSSLPVNTSLSASNSP